MARGARGGEVAADVGFARDDGERRSPCDGADCAVPEAVRLRREASAGGLWRPVFAWGGVDPLRAVAAGGASEVGAASVDAGAFGSGLPRCARLARELGAFGSAVGSTGFVTLRVIRAMPTRPPAAL